ncbi:hypothetical protein GALL_355740 [mine drainage metagenome]|uniref:Uncharacterized protein n=1 Tax=mine drainage metagenome TaxID=410659 RepID=A0A1J5QGH3_9ZZZZ
MLQASVFPSGRWVLSGSGGGALTSSATLNEYLAFSAKNEVSETHLKLAAKNEFTWPRAMFEPSREVLSEFGDVLKEKTMKKTLSCPVCGAPNMELRSHTTEQLYICATFPRCEGKRLLTDPDASTYFFDITDEFMSRHGHLKMAQKNQVGAGVVVESCGYWAVLSLGRGQLVMHQFEGLVPKVGLSFDESEKLRFVKKVER